MPDDFGRFVAAIEGEDPSPDFVSSLRTELEAELGDEQSEGLDDAVVVDLDPLDAAPPTGRQTVERKWLVVGGAAAAVVLLIAVVAGIAFAADDGADDEVAAGGIVAGPPVAEDYFEALADGDAEAAVNLMTSDVAISQTWIDRPGDSPGVPTDNTPERFQAVQTWLIAQGTDFSSPSCSATEEGAETTTVSCEWEVYNGIAQAVGAGPLPVVTTMVITEAGIASYHQAHGPPSYNRVWTPFGEWMAATHPDVVHFFDAESVEASRENGLRAAEYAAEWARVLEATGCSYEDDPCTEEVRLGRAFMEARDAWDGEATVALVAGDAVIDDFATTAEEFLALADWHRAIGARNEASVCREMREGPPAEVRCFYEVENAWSRALGVGPFAGSSIYFTIADGQITELSNTFNTARFSPQVWEPFVGWVSDTHPADIDVMFSAERDLTSDPNLTPESIALWEQYTDEFVESLAE